MEALRLKKNLLHGKGIWSQGSERETREEKEKEDGGSWEGLERKETIRETLKRKIKETGEK